MVMVKLKKEEKGSMDSPVNNGICKSLLLGLVVRLLFMLYGMWQDDTMAVKYTDVDYYVFTDAARFVTEGKSPYQRATYRYTPLLSWMLTPNIFATAVFGKLLFILGDLIASVLLYKILLIKGYEPSLCKLCSYLWLFNPLAITVSTRGNAESIMAVLVLGTIYLMTTDSTWGYLLGAMVYALAVHMKIYPITYALPLYLYMNSDFFTEFQDVKSKAKRVFGLDLFPNQTRLLFIFVGASTLFMFTYFFWFLYGEEFLQETYFYHITRKDTRHNFSPYFYMLYLTAESDWAPVLGLAAFLPQAILLVTVSVLYYGDLPFCCFLQTFLFVAFNKVCTSQYFLWYLCLLPLIIPKLKLTLKEAITMTTVWFLGQGIWLLPAYFLEFEGKNSFLFIWLAGLAFFIINIAILGKLILSYNYESTYKNGNLIKQKSDIFITEALQKYI